MTLIPFAPPPGLNSDDTTFKAEGRWADGNNVRFVDGAPQVIGGIDIGSISNTAFTTARSVMSLGDARYIVASSSAPKLQVVSGGTAFDISPAMGSAVAYMLQRWGSYVLLGQASGTIYEWQGNTGVVAAALTNAPASIQGMIVTPQRQVLVGGCTPVAGGSAVPLCIRGSDLEDNNTWTPTATNNAFEDLLEGGGGSLIVAMAVVGDYVAVWTDTSLWLGTFLGDPSQTYRWDKISDGCGAITFESVVVVGPSAFWVSPDKRFWSWSLGAPPQRVVCPIGNEFAAYLTLPGGGARIGGWYNMVFNEAWFFYQDSRDSGTLGTFTRYVALSLTDGSWFRGQGVYRALGKGIAQQVYPYPYTIPSAGRITLHDFGTTHSSALTWHIQSADQYIEESQRRMLIRGILPDFEDQGASISLTLYARDRPMSSATTIGPHTLTTSTTKKDFRASGKIVAVKFSGSSTTPHARFGKQLFDAVPLGER